MIRGQRGYRADVKGHKNVVTALAAGHPLAIGLAGDIEQKRADQLSPATQTAIAIAVAAEYCDAKTVADYCRAWQVRTEWYDRQLIASRTDRRLRIIVEREGEVTGVYEPLKKLSMLQQIAETIAANGGRS